MMDSIHMMQFFMSYEDSFWSFSFRYMMHICYVYHRQTSNIKRTWLGNKLVDQSDVVGASAVGAAPVGASADGATPTTSSIST